MTTDTPTIFGLPAAAVTNPDGTEVLYLITEEVPHRWECRAFQLTSPAGEVYRVAEIQGDGGFTCTCAAASLGKRRGGLRFMVRGVPTCKHCASPQTFGPADVEAEAAS